MKKTEKETTTYLFRDLPIPFWRKVKMLCAQKNITIRTLFIEILEKEFEKERNNINQII